MCRLFLCSLYVFSAEKLELSKKDQFTVCETPVSCPLIEPTVCPAQNFIVSRVEPDETCESSTFESVSSCEPNATCSNACK